MQQRTLFDGVPDAALSTDDIRNRHVTKAAPNARLCERCGKEFRPKAQHPSQRFCTVRCRSAANALRHYHANREKVRGKENSERRGNPKWAEYNRNWRIANRERQTVNAREWREKNKDRVLNAHLQRTYGISVHEFNRMLREQNGCCAICGTREAKSKSGGVRLHVDHDHVTGKARGLLCGTCNRGIGQLGDDLERVLAAVRYLERSQVTSKPKKDEGSA